MFRWRGLLALPIALAIVAILYWPILAFKFNIIDDGVNIFHNPYISDPHSQNIGILWTHGYYALYMPLTYTIWGICARIDPLATAQPVPPGGANVSILNPAVFHAASLLLHLGVTALVFGILRCVRIARWQSAVGALLFAIHPVQVQSVAWITGMNNLTGGFFGLMALWLYLLSVEANIIGPGIAKSRAFYIAATAAFVAAVLCKPTATIIPVFAGLFEYVFFRRRFKQWGARLGLWILPSIGCAIANSIIAKQDNGAVWSPLWGRPFVVGDSMAFGIDRLFLPIGSTMDYGRSPHFVLGHWWGYVTWLLPASVFCLYLRLQTTLSPLGRRIATLSGLLFIAGLLPTLGIVPYYTQWVSSVSDRYLYLPLLGPAIAASYLLSQPNPIRRYAAPAAAAIVLIFAFQTKRLLPVWKDMNSLTDSMLALSPNSWIAHGNEGYICGGRGDLACALREFTIADRLESPKTAQNRFFIGVTLTEMGRFDEAIGPLSDAFKLNPADDEMAYQLWNALAYLKHMDEAEAVLARHLAVRPNDGRSQLNMGKTLVARQDPRDALAALLTAEKLLPSEPAVEFFLGVAFERENNYQEALTHYRRAGEMDPGRPEIAEAISRVQTRQ